MNMIYLTRQKYFYYGVIYIFHKREGTVMTIIIYGSNEDTTFSKVLLKVLARYGEINFYSAKKIKYISEHSRSYNARFFIYELDNLPLNIDCEGLFIFKKLFKDLSREKFPEKFLPIVDEQNINAIKCLEKIGKITVTCGLSDKNTISFSSISDTEAVVTLQRYLNKKGKIIEPHEFILNFSKPYDPNVLLIISGVLLLSDVPSQNGYKF